MSQIRRRSGIFVVPGDRLGVIEEFIPGPGTYVRDGVLYSKITGRVLLDLLNKKASVYPLVRRVNVPRVRSIVIGQVMSVQTKIAVLRISKVEDREIPGFFTGILHISDVSPKYIEDMFDVCRVGDILRARVISNKNRIYHLSTMEENLGVIYAFCSRCGYLLAPKGERMQCARCDKIEKRKVASDYGREEME